MNTEDKNMFLYVGAYENEMTAQEDLEALKQLHSEGWIGVYDAGIVVKDDDGKLKIDRHTDSTGKGARRGLVVGAVLGIIFPPSVLVSGALGAGAGALIGHNFNDISKNDLKEIGAFLEENEAALVIIGEAKVEEMVKKATKQALKDYQKEFKADVKEYNKELDDVIKDI